MWSAVLVALLAVGQAGAPPPQGGGGRGGVIAMANRPDPLELTLASPVQLPDGRQIGTSVSGVAGPAGSDPWFVYSRGTLCESVMTRGPAPGDATDGWRVSVVERSRTATHVMVGVTWLRMWERGKPVATGSGGTNELTLQRGDRIGLDQITRPSQPACAATVKSLELRVGTTTLFLASSDPEASIEGTVDAELWMVHRAPNGTETVEHQVVRLMTGTIGFTFRGRAVDTTDGPMVMELSGKLKAVKRADGTRALWAGLSRQVTHQPTGRLVYSGSAPGKTVDWVSPGEVVSFDMPDPYVAAGAFMGRGGAGGGGRGGRVGGGVISSSGNSGVAGAATGGSGATAVARGTGGGAAIAAIPRGPNVLEGHSLSLRLRLLDTK
jgi:hypothetical protein